MMHAAAPNAPFGGVGSSGHGSYHGKHGIIAFSHHRTVLQLPTWVDKLMGARYPPYDLRKREVVKNSLGFNKGEGLEDQKIGGWWSWWW
jgi:aldehyde dehydrogenase (NAD+)